MAIVTLIIAAPLTADGSTGVAVHLGGGGSAGKPYAGYRGIYDWRAGLVNRPRFTTAVEFAQAGPTGGSIPQIAALQFGSDDAGLISNLGRLYWTNAPIQVWSGDDSASPITWALDIVGTVAGYAVQNSLLTLTISDLSGNLQKPVAPDTFAGTGGIEGGTDATGRMKRRTWGRAFNIEGRLLDSANNVYEFSDPARPLQDFPLVKDKGNSASSVVYVAWQGSIADTLTALKGASAPQGGAALAPSIACVKWWTQPAGPLTADILGETAGGYVETAPQIAAAIASQLATVPTSNLGAAVAARPGAAGVHCDSSTETGANILDRLLLPVSLIWIVQTDGTMAFRPMTWDGPVISLVSDSVQRQAVFNPLRTRKLGFQANNRIQSDGEIAAVILANSDLTYVDGTPIEVLKPAEAGANVTGNHTASGIFGQGLFATLNSAGYGSPLLTGFGGLSPLNSITFGSSYLIDPQTGIGAVLANFKTILGSAASILGQGSLATQGGIDWYGSQLFNIPAFAVHAFGSGAGVLFGALDSGYIGHGGTGKILGNVYPDEFGANKTQNNTAAAFAGQGAFATQNYLDLTNAAYFAYGGRFAPLDNGDSRYFNASVIYYGNNSIGYANLQSLKPDEGGANRTETRTAAAILGQSQLATAPFGLNQYGAIDTQYIDQTGVARLKDRFPAEANANVTENRTAAAIAGQGAFATASYITQSNYFSYFSLNAVSLNHTVTRQDGATVVTESDTITYLGISAGFAGQARLATVNYAGGDDLTFGATEEASVYYFQGPNDNNQNDFSAGPLGTGIVPSKGSPIHGHFSFVCRALGSNTTVYMKVIRVSDGVAVWGGSGGQAVYVGTGGQTISGDFFDSTAAGTRQQYDLRFAVQGGSVRSTCRVLKLIEMKNAHWNELYLVSDEVGTGPGAMATGGQVNGGNDPTSGGTSGDAGDGFGQYLDYR